MSEILTYEEQKVFAEHSPEVAGKAEGDSAGCSMQRKGWFKGPLGMAICCGAPILLVTAISFFGFSLGAIASGALSLVALLACPVGVFLMMRMMMRER